MGSLKKLVRSGLFRFGAATAQLLLDRPTIRSAIRGQVRKLATGNREKPYRPLQEVERIAEQVAIRLQGCLPPAASLGIDGIAGSGKSSLGRTLAQRLGLEWHTLHSPQMDEPVPMGPGAIYENIRLLRTQEIDHFTAIIYIDMPIALARQRVISRDRNGALADVLDFETLKIIGDMAFAAADGEEMSIPDSHVRMKLRPPGGYRHLENLQRMAREAGYDTANRCKEELLFLLCSGEARRGIKSYLNFGAYNRELLLGALEGFRFVINRLT